MKTSAEKETSPSKIIDFNKFNKDIRLKNGSIASIGKTFPNGFHSMVEKWNNDIVYRLALWACQQRLKREVHSWIKSGLSIEEIKKKVRYWKPKV